jgi:hypothetical protein
MTTQPASIPGYRLGDPTLAPAPYTLEDLSKLKAALLFGDDDLLALRQAGEILVPQTEAILDVWYGFVGSHDFLLEAFASPAGPQPEYLARVRARFGQWIADTCAGVYDDAWLTYQWEIGQRHWMGKNRTDAPASDGTPPFIPWRYVNALIYPIAVTIRPFLERGTTDTAQVERMAMAWLKAVLLQVTLWSQPYLRESAW